MSSQTLSDFQWKNRLIILLSKNETSEKIKEQIIILHQNPEALRERKLRLIHAVPGKSRNLFPIITDWKYSNLYEDLSNNNDVEIVLIGLDGGEKLRQTESIKTKQLFDLIDSMPMRKAEIQNKNN